MPKINYVIATWDGKHWSEVGVGQRSVLDIIGNPKGDEVLAVHLEYLSKLKHNLAQITIMKPIPHNKPKYEQYYTKAEQVISNCFFSCPIQIIETNTYLLYSYRQWWHAYELFKDQFDYYIFVEDDTVAAIPYFDTILTTMYHQMIPNQLGYLCSKVFPFAFEFGKTDYEKYDHRLATMEHAAISSGITNTKTLARLYTHYGGQVYFQLENFLEHELKITKHPFNYGCMKQLNFSLMFTHSRFSCIKDYTQVFLSPFWDRDSLFQKKHIYQEYSNLKQDCAVPLIMPVTMCCDGSEQIYRLLDPIGALPEHIAKQRIQLIASNREITELDLSNEYLSNELLREFTNNQNIRRLNISGNNVSDRSVLRTMKLVELLCEGTNL